MLTLLPLVWKTAAYAGVAATQAVAVMPARRVADGENALA